MEPVAPASENWKSPLAALPLFCAAAESVNKNSTDTNDRTLFIVCTPLSLFAGGTATQHRLFFAEVQDGAGFVIRITRARRTSAKPKGRRRALSCSTLRGSMEPTSDSLALVLTGGGARAAYQVGVLRCLARRLPQTRFDIITGVSAGAINAIFLASRRGALTDIVEELRQVWSTLQLKDVVPIDSASMARNVLGWGTKLVSGGATMTPRVHGLVDTTPLRRLLEKLFPAAEHGGIKGLEENLAHCDPNAVAITSLDYTTGQTVTWVEGCDLPMWERPLRRSVRTTFTIDHILASAALPIVFPAVQPGTPGQGAGGLRLSAPLSPALHLGATRMLAVSTHYGKSFSEANEEQVSGYPPPAQILGQLMDAIFLDVMDEDVVRMENS